MVSKAIVDYVERREQTARTDAIRSIAHAQKRLAEAVYQLTGDADLNPRRVAAVDVEEAIESLKEALGEL